MGDERFTLVGIGEVLWDEFPAGRRLGGAPANFAAHACALGERGAVVSAVGDDASGREILAQLDALGVDRRAVAIDPAHPTGRVTVTLDGAGGHAFTIHEGVAWDHLPAAGAALDVVAHASVVCFGTLAQRTPSARAAIRALVDAAPRPALRVFDVNLRQAWYDAALLRELLPSADVVKLNDEELAVLAGLFGWPGGEDARLRALLGDRPGRLVALTRGANGSRLVSAEKDHALPGLDLKVVDTVGAGDSFTATLCVGLLRGLPLPTVHAWARAVAGYVCTQSGAVPPLPDELRTPRTCKGEPAP